MTSESNHPVISPNSSGSRLYVAGYVGHSIRKNKSRFFSLLIGIMIGVALVSSVFVWTDTDSHVATLDYFNSNTYQYGIHQIYHFPVDTQLIYEVENWCREQTAYQDSDIFYQSIGFLNGTDWNSSTTYLPYPYTREIKDFQAFFAENAFLTRVVSQFTYDGVFQLAPGECLVSTRVIEDASEFLNQIITVGSYINVTIASIYQEPLTFGDIQPFNTTNLHVVGIYNITRSNSLLFSSALGTYRVNHPGSAHESVFGWNDGIIMHYSQLNSAERDILTANSLFPILLVQLNPQEIAVAGLENVPTTIRELQAQMELQFTGSVTVSGEDQVVLLEQYIAASQSRRIMAVLTLPTILLSILLTIFATNIFLSGRRSEVAILRARGASFRQLYAAFILEFIIIGTMALGLGVALSILVGSLIPASIGFLQFNPAIFYIYLANVRLQPLTWLVAFLTCIIPPLGFTLISVRSFLKAEIYEAMVSSTPHGEADFGITIIYTIAVFALLGFLIVALLLLPVTPSIATILFIYAVVVWALFSDIGSRIVRQIIAGVTRGFRPLFGEKSFIFEKSMRTRRQRIVPLLLILTLTFSISIFAVVEAQTVQDNVFTQVSYFMGSDLRVESGSIHHNCTSEILSIPGIISASAFIATYGLLGSTSLMLYGVDVDYYSRTGNWDLSSMVGEDPFAALQRLQNNTDGIIIPHTLAELLGRSVGNRIVISVHQQGGGVLGDTSFLITGIGRSAPGLGYFDPNDPSRPPDPTDGFHFQSPQLFAIINSDFLLNRNMTNTRLILANVAENVDIVQVQQQVSGLSFPTAVYSPMTYSLQDDYPEGHLFNRGVISLLSIGFLACVVISIIALILFVGIIVRERQTEYAIMRAVGSTQRQISAIIVGEFAGLIITSFLVALLLGFFFSWLSMFILLDLFPFPYVIPFQLGVPWVLLFGVLGVVLIGISIGTYIPAHRAGQTNVGKVLRNL
ncbi:MAG: ABC transporter permease [Promethearchaeota archaeon]